MNEITVLKQGALYPFYDQLSQNVDLPVFLYYIQILWMIFQSILIVLWVPKSVPIGESGAMRDFANGLFLITCFTPFNATSQSLLITFLVCIIVLVVSIIYIAVQLITYLNRRRFVHSLLYVARCMVEIVPHIMTFPAAAVAGLSAQMGLRGESGPYYVYFGVGCLVFVAYEVVGQVTVSFLGGSAYLPASPFALFLRSAYRHLMVGVPAVFLVSAMGDYFNGWFVLVVIAFHVGLCVLLFVEFSYRPFMADWMNCIFLTLCVYGILMDVVNAILRFADQEAGGVLLALTFLLLIVSGVVVFFFNRRQTKQLLRKLSEASDPPPNSEEEQFQEFDDLGMDASQTRALFYLNFAVTRHDMRFYDFLFMKYIVLHFRDAWVLAHCARLISWMPGCARPLNFLCAEAVARRDIGIEERFVLFQLERIRLLRESSVSATAAEKLTTVKTASGEAAALVRAFWERSECNIALLNRFSRQLGNMDSLWNEAIDDFPNSVQFRDVYITYLVEGATRFSDAVFQKSRADMIENGVDFRVDNCFRRFIRRFPDFLKRGILDVKGNAIKRSGANKTNHTSGSSQGELSGGVLDIGVEEGIGKAIIAQARVRLTVERAFIGRRPATFQGIVVTTIFVLAVCVGTFVFVDVYFSTYFDTRGEVAQRIALQNFARFYLFSSVYVWIYFWGTADTTRVMNDDFLLALETMDGTMPWSTFFSQEVGWEDNAMIFNVNARTNYISLMTSVMNMAKDGIDIFVYASALFNASAIPLTFCSRKGIRTNTTWYGNMRTVWTYYFMQTSLFMGVAQVENWFTVGNERLCVVAASMGSAGEAFTGFRATLSSMAEVAASEASSLLSPLKFALPGGLLGFVMILFGIASFLYVREVNHFATLLLNLPKSVKRECMKPLRVDATRDENANLGGNSMLALPGHSLPLIFNGMIVVVLAGACAVLLAQMMNVEDTNQSYFFLNNWIVYGRSRKGFVIESALAALFAVIDYSNLTQFENGTNYINATEMIAMAYLGINQLSATNKQLLELDETGLPSVVGYDDQIDYYQLRSQCENDKATGNFHDYYRCSSAVQLMQFHIDAVQEVLLDPSVYGGVLDGTSHFGQIVHLLDWHLLPMLMRIDDLFGGLDVTFKTNFLSSHQLFFGLELGLMVIAGILVLIYCWTVNSCYDVLLILLRRIAPAHILACHALENYLLNKSTGKRREGLTPDERIIDASADCIVCMGPTGVIDMINPAVTHAFGYTPEQLIGQLLLSLLAPDHAERISGMIKLMADKQSAPLFEGHTTCITDDEKEIPCTISLLAIFDGEEVNSFVAILKDESLLLQQQTEAETAKSQSETLLFQILPRNIVSRINANEKDISFSIPSATIMFIDIVKFSEYAVNLTPQEIMGNLSLIFCSFDDACVKHPLLMKIKLIGDVYMCAGGLFDPDVPPASHAEQMIKFALDALQIIDDTNVKLNAELAVRIGVNSGGPIIAGVLGTDKPVFDIIGDPINIAARLQSTSMPGKIQISEDTHALVSAMDFQFDCRGDVDLKGKGKTRTYWVDSMKDPSIMLGLSTSLEDFARFVPGDSGRPN